MLHKCNLARSSSLSWCIHCLFVLLDHTVVHSYGRLIPHEFPITDLQQIYGPDGIGRINCTVSSGSARFNRRDRRMPGTDEEVKMTGNGAPATLVVKPTNVESFTNRDMNCNSDSSFFYLFLSPMSELTIYIT